MMISLDNPVWFSPLNVISHFKRIEADSSDDQKKSKDFRKAKEAYAVAIMLVGIRKILDREFWLQAVDDKAQSPDVRTGTFVPPRRTKSDDFSIQDVEVVEYGNNSNNSLADFLKETKLSKGKSYDALTTILCNITRDTRIPPLKDIQLELAALKVKCPVMILGRTSPEQETYKVAQINPTVDMVTEFDLIHELKNKKYKGVLSLRRGTTPQTDYRPEEKHFPFEKLKI